VTIPRREDLLYTLQDYQRRFAHRMLIILQQTRQRLETRTRLLLQNKPLEQVRQRAQRLDELSGRLIQAAQQTLKIQQMALESYRQTLEALNPREVLNRGFAIVYHLPERTLVKSRTQVKPGTQVGVELSDGNFSAEVLKIEKNPKSKH
jgi:exodeoxyribonuclease VII large subunit